MTPETLNRNKSKWPELRILFKSRDLLYLQNVLELYLVKDFYFKNSCFRRFFNLKVKASICLWWCFCEFGRLESYITPRWPKGVRRDKGGSHRESSLLPIGHLEVICDPQLHGYALFLAIRIRVNFWTSPIGPSSITLFVPFPYSGLDM